MERYRAMLADAAFAIVDEGTLTHGYSDAEERKPESHPMVLAQKAARPS